LKFSKSVLAPLLIFGTLTQWQRSVKNIGGKFYPRAQNVCAAFFIPNADSVRVVSSSSGFCQSQATN